MPRLHLFAAFVFLALGLLTGCGGGSKTRRLSPDVNFSLNVIAVPPDWPDEKKDWSKDPQIALHQQATYEKHGRPDYFLIKWNRDGRLKSGREFQAEMATAKTKSASKMMRMRSPDFEWVYTEKKLLFGFKRSGPVEKELPDTIATVCEYGDPHEMKEDRDVADQKTEIFQYYDTGKIYYYRDGKKYKEENTKPMPGMMWRY